MFWELESIGVSYGVHLRLFATIVLDYDLSTTVSVINIRTGSTTADDILIENEIAVFIDLCKQGGK